MNPNTTLLKSLEPPSRGLEGLRDRLRRRRRQQSTTTALAIAVLALGWFSSVQRQPSPEPGWSGNHPFMRLAKNDFATPVRMVNGVALELPSTRPDTRIFLVDSTL